MEMDEKSTRIWGGGEIIEIADYWLRRFRTEGGVKKHQVLQTFQTCSSPTGACLAALVLTLW